MGHMKYVLQLAQNYRAAELERLINAAEAYDNETITFDNEIITIKRARGMYLLIKEFQDRETNINLNG